MSTRNCLLSYKFDDSPLEVMMGLAGARSYEIVVNLGLSCSETQKKAFKATRDLVNPNIVSKEVNLQECLVDSFKPEMLENYECQHCKAKDQ